jgi:hypothetical protein
METIERDAEGWPVLKEGMQLGKGLNPVRIVLVKHGIAMMLNWAIQAGFETDEAVASHCRKYYREFSADDGRTWHPYTQEKPKPLAPERVWVNVYASGSVFAHISESRAKEEASIGRHPPATVVEYIRADAVQGCIDFVREGAAGRWMSTDAARAAVATLPK